MIYFNNDYSEGCHEKIMSRLQETNMQQTPGYGTDPFCKSAADKIRAACGNLDLQVHFLVGGTQTNLTVIDAALRPHQGVIGASSAHIHTHETGAVEATGHKVLEIESEDGKINSNQIKQLIVDHYSSDCAEHTVQPKMVYISNPTELGTLYTRKELQELASVCHDNGLYLFMDGARLGYGLTAQENDVTLKDIASLCDVFYIGGTKVGALFGEAVVIKNPALQEDFRYLIKQHGGMLAKGRLLGLQFDTLFTDNLYFEISKHANMLADQIRDTLASLDIPLFISGSTNQIFAVLPDDLLANLERYFVFEHQGRFDAAHQIIRICSSWATTQENTDLLCQKLRELC